MKKESREALNAYYAEAGSWADDRSAGLRSSRRIAWWVAIAALIVACGETIIIILLTPLKTVVPYTLMVDRQTGFVQLLKPLEPATISADKALTQSFIVQYVIAREGFDIDELQRDYRQVALWSTGSARASYIAMMQASNPNSPLATLPRTTIVNVEVKSVTSLSTNTALVRFNTIRLDRNGQSGSPVAWNAVIKYTFSGEPMSAADRMTNPLGFKVVRYRKSQEMLTPETSDTTRSMTVETSAIPASPTSVSSGPDIMVRRSTSVETRRTALP